MRSAARCAATEVEHAHAAGDHLLHERPIQQHVGREWTRFAQRSGPRHLELVTPDEAAACRKWLIAPVHDPEHGELRKGGSDPFEEGARQHGGTEVSHGPREHLVERFSLLGPEPNGEPFLHWTANLTAELGGE